MHDTLRIGTLVRGGEAVAVIPQIVQHGFESFNLNFWQTTGDTNLRQAGYKGTIDIEGWHDPVYQGELEMTGQVHALNYLKYCRGGSFVPNPV
jgi:hypothetical protein